MKLTDVSVPECYSDQSSDFRFFLKWFELCLTRIQYLQENFFDLYDPLRCPHWLLWLLADSMGYKYDDRLPISYCRLVLLNFMNMIRNRGSKEGVMLAAQVNLAQFNILAYGEENDILFNRLEDTSIPVNSVTVTPHKEEGYFDIVYFSDSIPVDACLEYVRPIGMYAFQHEGIFYNARTKIAVDARLTNRGDIYENLGSTNVGHYTRKDYASIQKMSDERRNIPNPDSKRDGVWFNNSEFEGDPGIYPNPGWRALYTLQVSNNEHVVNSLVKEPIFTLGYGPQDVSVTYPEDYWSNPSDEDYLRPYNLRYNRQLEESMGSDIYTVDDSRTNNILNPRPAVGPIMSRLGDGMATDNTYTSFILRYADGSTKIVDAETLAGHDPYSYYDALTKTISSVSAYYNPETNTIVFAYETYDEDEKTVRSPQF